MISKPYDKGQFEKLEIHLRFDVGQKYKKYNEQYLMKWVKAGYKNIGFKTQITKKDILSM